MGNRGNFERIKCSVLLLIHSCKAGSAHGVPAVARAGAVKQPTVATTGAERLPHGRGAPVGCGHATGAASAAAPCRGRATP